MKYKHLPILSNGNSRKTRLADNRTLFAFLATFRCTFIHKCTRTDWPSLPGRNHPPSFPCHPPLCRQTWISVSRASCSEVYSMIYDVYCKRKPSSLIQSTGNMVKIYPQIRNFSRRTQKFFLISDSITSKYASSLNHSWRASTRAK